MPKFDLHKTRGIDNVMNAVKQVKSVNNILPLVEAKELLIESLYPSGENFYSVSDLDELADSIRQIGVLQPLLVSEKGGTYEIISGNRRYEAAKMAGLERLPCVVKQNVEPSLFTIMLIHANMFRVKTDMERAREVSELRNALRALKASNQSIQGRTEEIAGQILNLSPRQVIRLDNLNKLIPEIQGLVQSDRLTASCAEQFANLDEGIQKEIFAALTDSGTEINRQEAARLREEFLAKSRELESQVEADREDLQARLREEQEKLLEKERELDALTMRLRAREAEPAADVPRDKKELDKVKQALVAALQDRKDMEERYNELLGQRDFIQVPLTADAGRMMSDAKRKAQLKECIVQLKLAARTYAEYKSLFRSVHPTVKPSVGEIDLLNELVINVKELSRLIAAE